jgi:Na+:H+ antiporter, NhaA family
VSPQFNRFQRAWVVARDNSLLMVAGAITALVWVNVGPESYEHVRELLHFAVNDIAMAFFFGLAMKEIIEATAPGGALHSFRKAALPVVAAVGGMIGPAALYVAQAMALGRSEVLRGWAIPCATDIAFSYLVIRLIFAPTHPAVPFLLLLAIADDAFGLLLLAAFYPSAPLQPLRFIVLLAAACAIAWQLRRRGTRTFWPYVLIAGSISWAALYVGGLHPALALVPILPFVPHAERDPGLYVEADHRTHDPLTEFEHWWSTPVEFILFFFALANAGVPLSSTGAVTWLVLGSLIVGKPLGIGVATWIAERAGLLRPHGLGWRELMVLGIAAGIGFTVALFFATAAFAPGDVQDQAKLGAMLSVGAAVFALAAAQLLRVGRLKRPKVW